MMMMMMEEEEEERGAVQQWRGLGSGPVQARFSPYAFNGGTILAIAGEDFALLASDTRLSEHFSIHTRDAPKVHTLSDRTVLGCCGFHGDCLTLTKIIDARRKMYQHTYNKPMGTGALAAMLSTILYQRRFFPYYAYNIVGGLDDNGKGVVYGFDPVGSYESNAYIAGGSANAMLQPLLDNQIGQKNQQGGGQRLAISEEQAVQLARDVFVSAAERDIYTGDALRVCVVTRTGVRQETHSLRRD